MPIPLILDRFDIIEGFKPVDMSTGANNGDWISLKDAEAVAVVLLAAVGAAGEPPTITLQQAQDVAGTGAKSLSVAVTGRVYTKQAATDLTATGAFSKITQAAAATYTSANNGDKDKVWVIEIKPEDLDATNGFDCIRATIADVGATAQLGTLFYLYEKKNQAGPDRSLSHIVD